MRVYRPSNTSKELETQHLALMQEALARSREVLKSPPPDTFAGRKTQEPFPGEKDEKKRIR